MDKYLGGLVTAYLPNGQLPRRPSYCLSTKWTNTSEGDGRQAGACGPGHVRAVDGLEETPHPLAEQLVVFPARGKDLPGGGAILWINM